jgi:GxxExxY protein
MAPPLRRTYINTKITKKHEAENREGKVLTRANTILDPETELTVGRTIGCAIEVHRALGPGYLEAIYQDAMAIELAAAGLPFEREVLTPVYYRGHLLRGHRLDLVVARRVVVELKAVERLDAIHTSQVVAYLKASCLRLGLLMNFNAPALKSGLRRIVR